MGDLLRLSDGLTVVGVALRLALIGVDVVGELVGLGLGLADGLAVVGVALLLSDGVDVVG